MFQIISICAVEIILYSQCEFPDINVPIHLIAVSLALLERVTVMKGQTLNLSCPISNPHKTTVEWKNPKGYIMFFNHNKGEDDI